MNEQDTYPKGKARPKWGLTIREALEIERRTGITLPRLAEIRQIHAALREVVR